MKPNTIIQLINDMATKALRQAYTDDHNHIAIESINLNFSCSPSYMAIVRCGIDTLLTAFEVETVVGLPDNPFAFNQTEAYAFAIHIANIAIKIYKASQEQPQQEDQDLIYDPNDSHGVC